MKRLKVRRIGNSLGAIIPREMLQRMRIDEGDEIFAVEEADGIKLTAFDPEFPRAMKAFEEGRKKYRNALRKLAE
ncbi:MAG: AbrB/MazE/SpoVT family DNA-binding domain-containing protein [Candidatus Hydrogenedentes bacterium]|nr:AbrB/MazE/SpoVT family DNA-binding domain-containing protein [Candidatus Hydrogenedentota bacterium]